MNKFKTDENINKIPFKLYLLLSSRKVDLTMKTFCLDLLCFVFSDSQNNNNYNTANRYLFNPWSKDGSINEKKYASVGSKIAKRADEIMKNDAEFNIAYQNNTVTDIIHSNGLYKEIISLITTGISERQIKKVSLKTIRNSAQKKDSKTFLFLIVCAIYGIEPSVYNENTSIDKLSKLLSDNNQQIKHLYNYANNTLFKVGQSSTYGILETLYHAGPPENINRDCDAFTLLDAADIYYFHKLRWGQNAPNSMDMEYSYRYSKVAFEEYQSPQAAWNMGYIWQTQGRNNADPEYRFEINEFKSIPQTEEIYLITALEYFIFSAKHNYSEAYNSIGNICYKLLNENKDYPSVIKKILEFTDDLLQTNNANITSNPEKRRSHLKNAERELYKNAARRYSITGMSNYYRFLLKELKEQNNRIKALPLHIYLENVKAQIDEIKKYIDILCEYLLPTALTDKAALMLHRHDMNDWLHESRYTYDGKKLTATTDYDFIFDYYPKLSEGKNAVISLLEKATANEIPSLQTEQSYYYLSTIYFDDMKYQKANDYIKKAILIAGNPAPQSQIGRSIDRLNAQAEKCAMALENGYYIESNTPEWFPKGIVTLENLVTGESLEFDPTEDFYLGRSAKAQYCPDSQNTHISLIHACISCIDGHLLLSDVNSFNGTFLNGEKLKARKSVSLHNGDEIKLADGPSLRLIIKNQ